VNRLVLAGSGKGGWAFALHVDGQVVAVDSGGRAGASSWAMMCEALIAAVHKLPAGQTLVLARNDAFHALVHRIVAGDKVTKSQASRRLIEALEHKRDSGAHPPGQGKALDLVCADIEKTEPDYKTVKEAAMAAAPPPGSEKEAAPLGEVPKLADTQVWIWTDGGCRQAAGVGGWGTMIVHAASGATLELWGGTRDTTNNRMEMMAVIEGLDALQQPTHVELRVDSTYVRNVATKWAHAWKQNGWRKRDGEPVKNQDLVAELDRALTPHKVVWTWVKGHAGEPGNTRVDGLCGRAMEALLRGEEPAGQERHKVCPVVLPDRISPPESSVIVDSTSCS
jgi:ribonuclease HI